MAKFNNLPKEFWSTLNNQGQSSKTRSSRRQIVKTKSQIRKEEFLRIFKIIVSIILLGLFAALMSYILFSEDNQIATVSIKSTDSKIGSKIGELVSDNLKQKIIGISLTNKYLWTSTRLNNLVKTNYPQVSSINSSINGRELLLDIKIEVAVANWCKDKKCWGVLESGILFEHTDKSKELASKVLNMHPGSDLISHQKIGQSIINSNKLSLYLKLNETLDEMGYQVDKIEVFNDYIIVNISNKSELNTLEIRKIKLPTSSVNDLTKSIKDLLITIEGDQLVELSNKESVDYFELLDLTSPNKIFYRFSPLEKDLYE